MGICFCSGALRLGLSLSNCCVGFCLALLLCGFSLGSLDPLIGLRFGSRVALVLVCIFLRVNRGVEAVALVLCLLLRTCCSRSARISDSACWASA